MEKYTVWQMIRNRILSKSVGDPLKGTKWKLVQLVGPKQTKEVWNKQKRELTNGRGGRHETDRDTEEKINKKEREKHANTKLLMFVLSFFFLFKNRALL